MCLAMPANGGLRLHQVWNPNTLDNVMPQRFPATLHFVFTHRVILVGSGDTIYYWWIQ